MSSFSCTKNIVLSKRLNFNTKVLTILACPTASSPTYISIELLTKNIPVTKRLTLNSKGTCLFDNSVDVFRSNFYALEMNYLCTPTNLLFNNIQYQHKSNTSKANILVTDIYFCREFERLCES